MVTDANSKSAFIEFLLAHGVLKFGSFTLNSGRESPYFFNLGALASGPGLQRLGDAYAQAIEHVGIEFDVLFGPAYKGIPIAVATSVALAGRGVDVSVAYNRKEAKDHGEGGQLVGAAVTGKILLVDDVLTSGKAILQSAGMIKAAGAEVAGVVIALDRAEKGASGQTAVAELSAELGCPVLSIAHVRDVLGFLSSRAEHAASSEAMQRYVQEFCVWNA